MNLSKWGSDDVSELYKGRAAAAAKELGGRLKRERADRVLSLHAKGGWTAAAIAEEMGVSQSYVAGVLRANGITSPPHFRIPCGKPIPVELLNWPTFTDPEVAEEIMRIREERPMR